MNIVKKHNYKGYNITILYDEVYDLYCNEYTTKFVLFHKNYNFLNDLGLNSNDFEDWEEIKEHIINNENIAIIKPVYMYEHGNIAFSTEGFSCGYDSGQIGFAYITKEAQIEDLYKDADLNKVIKAELKHYNQYIEGEVFGFIIKKDNEQIDSCWGFVGEDSIKQIEREFKYYIDNLL